MKVTETERSYCIEIAKEQFFKILDRDSVDLYKTTTGTYAYPATLTSILSRIDGVCEVNYDGMFGPAIYIRLKSEDTAAMVRTLENVKRTIALYVK